MNPQRILEIGTELSGLYHERADISNDLDRLNLVRERRELELTPPEGWPGKNAETREVERNRTLAADDSLQNTISEARELKRRDVQAQADIAALEAERRGLEWTARLELAEKIGGRVDEAFPL